MDLQIKATFMVVRHKSVKADMPDQVSCNHLINSTPTMTLKPCKTLARIADTQKYLSLTVLCCYCTVFTTVDQYNDASRESWLTRLSVWVLVQVWCTILCATHQACDVFEKASIHLYNHYSPLYCPPSFPCSFQSTGLQLMMACCRTLWKGRGRATVWLGAL